jgi:hypothetical protein
MFGWKQETVGIIIGMRGDLFFRIFIPLSPSFVILLKRITPWLCKGKWRQKLHVFLTTLLGGREWWSSGAVPLARRVPRIGAWKYSKWQKKCDLILVSVKLIGKTAFAFLLRQQGLWIQEKTQFYVMLSYICRWTFSFPSVILGRSRNVEGSLFVSLWMHQTCMCIVLIRNKTASYDVNPDVFESLSVPNFPFVNPISRITPTEISE